MILGVALGAALLSLSASPERLELVPGAPQVVHLAHAGTPLAVDLSVTGLAVDLRGRSRVAARTDAARWLRVTPSHVVVGPLGANVHVVARVPRGARPGDHAAVVLVAAVAPGSSALVVHVRVGLVAIVRVPGRVVHRLAARAARIRAIRGARFVELVLVNRGNVVESLGDALRVRLVDGGRLLGVLRAERRYVLPHARAVVDLRYRGHAHGRVAVRVEWRPAARIVLLRSFHLRL